MSGKRFDTFISFHSVDRETVRELDRLLMTRQIAAWLDERETYAGLVPGQLAKGIECSDSVTVLCGTQGEGPWQNYEVENAVALAITERKLIIPILLPGAEKKHLPTTLKAFSYIAFADRLQDPVALASVDRMITGAPPGTLRRREIEALCVLLKGTSISDEMVLDAFLAVTEPMPGLEDFAAPAAGKVFDYCFDLLARLPHRSGHLPSVEFLKACQPHFVGLDTINSRLVGRWAKGIEARLGTVAIAAIPVLKPREKHAVDVLIKIAPDRYSDQFLLSAWLHESEKSPSASFYPPDERSVPISALPEHLAMALTALARQRPDLVETADFHLQIFAPLKLLCAPVESWPINIGGGVIRGCGLRHRVTVRSLDRVYDISYRQTWQEWRTKWDHCRGGLTLEAVHTVAAHGDYETAGDHLLRSETTALFALQPPPGRAGERIKEALVAGIPTLVWQRASLVALPAPEALLQALTPDILRWPFQVRELRRQALTTAPFWQEATVLLDDPDLLPPDADEAQRAPLPV